MARAGQNPTQIPQLSQPLRRMTNWRFASTMAERGHTASHAPQFMQLALIVYPAVAIEFVPRIRLALRDDFRAISFGESENGCLGPNGPRQLRRSAEMQ